MAEKGLNPETYGSRVYILNDNCVWFGQKPLGGRSSIPFAMDQSLLAGLAQRPFIPVRVKRNQAPSVSEGITHDGNSPALLLFPWALKHHSCFNCLLYLPCHPVLLSCQAIITDLRSCPHMCPFPHCKPTVHLAFLILISTNNCTSSSSVLAFD